LVSRNGLSPGAVVGAQPIARHLVVGLHAALRIEQEGGRGQVVEHHLVARAGKQRLLLGALQFVVLQLQFNLVDAQIL